MLYLRNIVGNLFHYVHISIIHFPIATLVLASIFGALDFVLVIGKKITPDSKIELKEKISLLISVLEIISVFNLLIAWLSLPIVGLMGLYDAGTVEFAVTTDLLAFKMQLATISIFVILIPLIFKLYLMKKTENKIFEDSVLRPIFYLVPVFIGTFLIILVAGAGGRYVFGHSVLDNVGLGFLIPQTFDYTFYYKHYPISFLAEKMTEPIGIVITFIIFLILIIIPFRRKSSNKVQL